MTNDELIAYYVSTLIIQYANKTNAPLTVQEVVRLIIIYTLILSVQGGYDIDTAVGSQLDLIGKYVGVNRNVQGNIFFTNTYFWLIKYTDTPPIPGTSGFNTYANPTTNVGEFRSYIQDFISTYSLTDDEMRFSIRCAIISNISNSSVQAYYALLYQIFGTDVKFAETGIMEITLTFPLAEQKTVQIAVSEEYLVAPMGVNLIIDYA